jgi:hypothetical protein
MTPCAPSSSPCSPRAGRSGGGDHPPVPDAELERRLHLQHRGDPRRGVPALRHPQRPETEAPAPRRDLDLTGYELSRRGRATIVSAGDTAVNKRARALRYGTKWSRGGFTCTSKKVGLRCRNRSGHGFFLSRAHSYRF